MKYPFSPKSNAKMEVGQFWPIPLHNGQFGCGIVLDVAGKDVLNFCRISVVVPSPAGARGNTRLFFGGLLDWLGDQPPTAAALLARQPIVLKSGLCHVKAITHLGLEISGKIDLTACGVSIPYQVDTMYYLPQAGTLLKQGFNIIRYSEPQDHVTYETQAILGYDMLNLFAQDELLSKY